MVNLFLEYLDILVDFWGFGNHKALNPPNPSQTTLISIISIEIGCYLHVHIHIPITGIRISMATYNMARWGLVGLVALVFQSDATSMANSHTIHPSSPAPPYHHAAYMPRITSNPKLMIRLKMKMALRIINNDRFQPEDPAPYVGYGTGAMSRAVSDHTPVRRRYDAGAALVRRRCVVDTAPGTVSVRCRCGVGALRHQTKTHRGYFLDPT